jgi:glycosyltransferase involved in cell wall biosynthesis
LEYRKGTDILLDAIPLVMRSHPDVHFQLIGIDPENSYESAFRKENNQLINKQVAFSGPLGDKQTNKAYAECDIFVAPSRYESFGLIYIEAMSFGKPVIGFNVGGVSEIIEDTVNGLYANFDDAVSLAEKISYLVANPAIRKTMGRNARKSVEEKFSDDILAANSVAYYHRVLLYKTST